MKVDLKVMDNIIKAAKKQNGVAYIASEELEVLCQAVQAAKIASNEMAIVYGENTIKKPVYTGPFKDSLVKAPT